MSGPDVIEMPDYFVNPRVIESFAKYSKPPDGEKKKLMYLAFQLEPDLNTHAFKNYAIKFMKLDPVVFTKLIKSAKYGDNLDAKQLSNLETTELHEFTPTLVNTNELVLPYSDELKVRRTYRLILDITEYDGTESKPDYRDVWSNLPLTIIAALEDPLVETPKLSLDLTITDCDSVIDELSKMVDELAEDLPLSDLNFVKDIISKCSCGMDKNDLCEFVGEEIGEFELPTLENESILFELTNLDSLICYLKNQLIAYKTDIATQSNTSSCYKFVPCLIRAYISINKLYRKSVAAHRALLLSAQYLSERYTALAQDHRRGIEAAKGIVNSNIEWIKSNLDLDFDLSKVTCSNRVEKTGDVSYTYKEKYSRYFNPVTKGYRS